jgi:hypothetical protein
VPSLFRTPVGAEKSTHTPAIADCGPNSQKHPRNLGFSLTTPSIAPVHKRGHIAEIASNSAGKAGKNNRSRFIKVRVSLDEHQELQRRADSHGQTLSEYVRHSVTAVHERLDVVAALEELRKQLSGSVVQAPSAATEPQIGSVESLLILRELAAARDSQILARVRARLAAPAADGRQKGSLA